MRERSSWNRPHRDGMSASAQRDSLSELSDLPGGVGTNRLNGAPSSTSPSSRRIRSRTLATIVENCWVSGGRVVQ
jgi:hypothetical protein